MATFVFTSSGTYTPSTGVKAVTVLIVGGGGGGGCHYGGGGGGGAGGVRILTGVSVSGATTVTIGAGGAGSANTLAQGSNGGDSAFGSYTALGGGGGGGYVGNGLNGGSGGGGSGYGDGAPTTGAAGTGTAGQGNSGGAGYFHAVGSQESGGGGGGAGAAGQAGALDNGSSGGGAGGVGINVSAIFGTSIGVSGWVGGGGGGANSNGGSFNNAGGQGGGGRGWGSRGGASAPVGGTANTGGGGGGGEYDTNSLGQAGGSGLVVVIENPPELGSYFGAGGPFRNFDLTSNSSILRRFSRRSIMPLATGLITDTFNRPNGTLTGQLTDTDNTWLAPTYGWNSNFGAAKIVSRQLAVDYANYSVVDTGATNGTVSIVYRSGTWPALFARESAMGMYVAQWNVASGQIELNRDSGSTSLATGIGGSAVSGQVFSMSTVTTGGSTVITVKVDNTTVINYTDSSASQRMGTRFGAGSTGSFDLRADDFNFTAAAGTPAVTGSLTGSGSFTATTTSIHTATAFLTGTGVVSATTASVSTASLTGSGDFSATVTVAYPAGATGSLDLSGVVSAQGSVGATGALALSGSLDAGGAVSRTADLTGSGAFTATALKVVAVAGSLTGTGAFTATAFKVGTVTGSLTGAGAFTATSRLAGPINDDFANAITVKIAEVGSTYISPAIRLENSTWETGEVEPANYGVSSSSIWWKYTPRVSGTASFDTQLTEDLGNGIDTEMAVYTGSTVSTLTKVYFDSDSGTGFTSVINNLSVTAGTTYWIQIGSYGADVMNVVLRVTGAPTIHTYDVSLTGTGTFSSTIVPIATATANLTGVGTFTARLDTDPYYVTADLTGTGTLAASAAAAAQALNTGAGNFSATIQRVVIANLTGVGTFSAVIHPIVRASAPWPGSGVFSASVFVFPSYGGEPIGDGPGGAYGIVRWVFRDMVTNQSVVLPLNPREMSTPTTPRNYSWAWGSGPGMKMRGIDVITQQPAEWTFTGVILTKSHYDLLLAWAKGSNTLQITDHLGRTFETIIQKFDPIERLPTAHREWRADYTMNCLLLRRIT